MADSTPQQPYQFGDVVNGHRWTITGWEPLSPPERTVGVPRLLEARYAATQAARGQSDLATLTDDPDEISVVDDHDAAAAEVDTRSDDDLTDDSPIDPVLVDDADITDEPWPPTGRVVAAPDLAIDFDAAPAEAGGLESHDGDGHDRGNEAPTHENRDEGDPDEPVDARPESLRAWYGLGWEDAPDPKPEEPRSPAYADQPADDDAFAAALAHGSRALAEQHEPSEIEIAAGIASRTRSDDDAPWIRMGWESIDEWTADSTAAPQQAPLDERAGSFSAGPFSAGPFPVATIPAPSRPVDPDPEPEPGPEAVTPSPAPPQGWYPGSV